MPEETEENIIEELEKAKIEPFSEIEEIESGIPFHQHTGVDGSPKVDNVSVKNKEVGGKYRNQIVKTASFSTDSTSYVDVTDLTITFTLEDEDRKFLLLLNAGDLYHSISGEVINFTINIDGSNVGDLVAYMTSGYPPRVPFSMSYITDSLSAGSHTFKVQMKVSTGTGYLGVGSSKTIFSAIELI